MPRGTRFDHHADDGALVCLATTMDATAAPYAVRATRLAAQGNYADGVALRISGQPPPTLEFFLGDSSVAAATLIDAIAEDLAVVEVVQGDGEGYQAVSARQLRMRGFEAREAALPVRRARAHQGHRLATEFLVFPAKFHFAALGGLPFRNGTEIRLRFSRPLALGPGLPEDVRLGEPRPGGQPVADVGDALRDQRPAAGVSGARRRAPLPGGWSATPWRRSTCTAAAARRCGWTRCWRPETSRRRDVRWGTRRAVSHAGAEVMLYFRGLDYRTLGRRTYLAAPRVLASNGDMARRGRVGERLYPVSGLGDWRAALASVPTGYRPALVQPEAMRSLIGYMQSSVGSLASTGRRSPLRRYLRQFAGGDEAAWIDAIGRVAVRPFATLRGGFPQPGVRAYVSFDSSRARTTSRTVMKRVLAELFDSQRGLNRVEEVVVVPG